MVVVSSHPLTNTTYLIIYAATHCNTLQHAVTRCHTLQIAGIFLLTRLPASYLHHTPWVTHCNTLQHTATHCNTLQHTAPSFAEKKKEPKHIGRAQKARQESAFVYEPRTIDMRVVVFFVGPKVPRWCMNSWRTVTNNLNASWTIHPAVGLTLIGSLRVTTRSVQWLSWGSPTKKRKEKEKLESRSTVTRLRLGCWNLVPSLTNPFVTSHFSWRRQPPENRTRSNG